MLEGVLITESLRAGVDLTGIPLTIASIERIEAGDASCDQPPRWTLLAFTGRDEHAELLADRLAPALAAPGWYVDFHTDTDVFIVFPDKTFRYRRGDTLGRAEAAEHGRANGVPESQLDWAE
jgi:hypothetical protein